MTAVNGTPMPKLGGAPNVQEVNGQFRVLWPDEPPEHFLIRTSLFLSMIDDINAGKRLASALERIRLTIDDLS